MSGFLWIVAAVRKGQASLGTFGCRLRSIFPQFEKVSQTASTRTTWQQNLGEGRYDIQLKDYQKPCHVPYLHIAHALHTSESVCFYPFVRLLEEGGRGFLRNWLPPDSRCPSPSVPPSPSLISASPAVRTTWPPENHQHHQQPRRDPPTTTTELFRVPLARLWPIVHRPQTHRNWALCNSDLPGEKRVGHKLRSNIVPLCGGTVSPFQYLFYETENLPQMWDVMFHLLKKD